MRKKVLLFTLMLSLGLAGCGTSSTAEKLASELEPANPSYEEVSAVSHQTYEDTHVEKEKKVLQNKTTELDDSFLRKYIDPDEFARLKNSVTAQLEQDKAKFRISESSYQSLLATVQQMAAEMETDEEMEQKKEALYNGLTEILEQAEVDLSEFQNSTKEQSDDPTASGTVSASSAVPEDTE